MLFRSAFLWETVSGKLRAVLDGHQMGIAIVAFSPDGSTILTGSFDRTARLWDSTKGKQLGDQTFKVFLDGYRLNGEELREASGLTGMPK